VCARLFLDRRVRQVLQQHYLEKVPDVMFRYRMMRSLEERSDPSLAPGGDGAAVRVGYGA
jgi:hypothetical protein